MTTAWCRRRSRSAVATTGSPKTSPHSAKPRLEVRIMALFSVAGVDELEEQIASAGHDRHVADLVDDEERGATEIADALAQGAIALGFCERPDDVGERREDDAAARLHGLDRQGCRKMALAGARGAEKVDHLGAIDELEFGQGHDAVAVERGLEGEVEALEGFDGGEARYHEGRLNPATLAKRELLDEDLIEGADAVDLALLDAPDGGVEDLEGARHPETD